jgi:NAD+ kinase
MSPICPRTFNARPILFKSDDILKVVPQSEVSYADYQVYLTIDGQEGFPLNDGDEIEVTASSHRARLGVIYKRDFFDLIRRKIG